jgi:hypothetical protein
MTLVDVQWDVGAVTYYKLHMWSETHSALQEFGCLNLNSVNQLTFVMVKCGVLFEVRTEFLNNI